MPLQFVWSEIFFLCIGELFFSFQ